MRARLAAGVACALIASACSGGSAATTTTTGPAATTTSVPETTTTTAPGFTVTSDDGDVLLEVPFEAMAADPGISITVLPPEEYPPELEGAAQNPNTRIYRLLPDTLSFDAPARITRTIDVSNFGDLPEHTVPIVVLTVRTGDGTYEVLDDLHVFRRGDRVEVSADITHFSMLVSVSEQQSMQLVPDDNHLGYATEQGVDLFVEALFHGLGGSPSLRPPDTMEPWGRTRSDAISLLRFGPGGSSPAIGCTGIDDAMPRIGFRVDLMADAPTDQVGLRSTPLLVPGLESLPVLLKSSVTFRCLDPATSLIGFPIDIRIQTDHPGGTTYIPGADFRGGLSGALGSISWTREPGITANIDYVGLICDINGNGVLDLGDAVYQPFMVESTGVNTGDFVLPLFGYADYFVYVLDGSSFSGVITTGPSGMSVQDALTAYGDLYTGNGRIETSMGLIGDRWPMVYTVGPAEDSIESDIYRLIATWQRNYYP